LSWYVCLATWLEHPHRIGAGAAGGGVTDDLQ
jgi:hypothetical protein